MHIGTVCRKPPVTVRRFEELIKAAQLMRQEHVGYLVVVEPDVADGSLRPVGVLTDRDIVVSVVAREVDPRTLCVGDVMTQPAVTASATDSVEKALQEMRRAGIRRLPVVGRRGELVGILSFDEVLDLLAGQLKDVAGSVQNEQRIEATLRQ